MNSIESSTIDLKTADRLAADRLAADRALAAAGAAELGFDASATEVIAWVARNFATAEVAVACSMADAVLPAVIAEQLPGVDVLFLETGYHFAETQVTRDEVAAALDVRIIDVLPMRTVEQQDAEWGPRLHERDPATCCRLRKMEPLATALSGYRLWFTGVRREEAPTRTNTPLITWDQAHSLIKVNPLAAWSFAQLTGYAAQHRVPVNLLLANGYPSIGCAPCTQPVPEGQDPRAGRWAGVAKTECGIHQ